MYYNGHMESRQGTDMKSRLAENIRVAMAQEDITTAELARRLEDHERQVRRWRNGETVPSFENVTKLAFELGREPGWFYLDHSERSAA
jgi:transcriptional regulator with XRE-family HTH domain